MFASSCFLVGLLHLFVLYGYQGADSDAEQLALTEQLFDAALGELSVVARGQPCLIVGDFNVEPTKIPCLAKGIWIAHHLAIRTLFDCCRWESRVMQSVQRTPLWLASWLPAIDKSRGSKSVEVQKVWEIYDERLQFMSRQDASLLNASP